MAKFQTSAILASGLEKTSKQSSKMQIKLKKYHLIVLYLKLKNSQINFLKFKKVNKKIKNYLWRNMKHVKAVPKKFQLSQISVCVNSDAYN